MKKYALLLSLLLVVIIAGCIEAETTPTETIVVEEEIIVVEETAPVEPVEETEVVETQPVEEEEWCVQTEDLNPISSVYINADNMKVMASTHAMKTSAKIDTVYRGDELLIYDLLTCPVPAAGDNYTIKNLSMEMRLRKGDTILAEHTYTLEEIVLYTYSITTLPIWWEDVVVDEVGEIILEGKLQYGLDKQNQTLCVSEKITVLDEEPQFSISDVTLENEKVYFTFSGLAGYTPYVRTSLNEFEEEPYTVLSIGDVSIRDYMFNYAYGTADVYCDRENNCNAKTEVTHGILANAICSGQTKYYFVFGLKNNDFYTAYFEDFRNVYKEQCENLGYE